MDDTVSGPVSHFRDGTGYQVIHGGARVLTRAPAFELVMSMAEQGNRQQNKRVAITVVLLFMLAFGFFAASFFVLV